MNPFEPEEGDYCYMVNARWPKFGWCPRKQFRRGKWRFAWFGRPTLLTSVDPLLIEKCHELMKTLIDEDGNSVSF